MISCEQPGKSPKNNGLNVIMRVADQQHYVVYGTNGTPLAHAAIVRGNLFRLTNGVCEVHASGFSVDGDVLTLYGARRVTLLCWR
jgi:hypothetical protein